MTVYSDEIVCAPRAGTLYDVLELILDRGMVLSVTGPLPCYSFVDAPSAPAGR